MNSDDNTRDALLSVEATIAAGAPPWLRFMRLTVDAEGPCVLRSSWLEMDADDIDVEGE